jgi:hypothetical protein
MIAAELEVKPTHRGRYLCGWVAVDDAFIGIASSSLLVEDVTRQLVEVGVYGLVDTDLPLYERQYRVASQFPKGNPIINLEPNFKVRHDMSEGIRVDKPHEMIEWAAVPSDLRSWKQLGNDIFGALNTRNEGRGTLMSYLRALQSVSPDVMALAVLMNNLETFQSKTGDFGAAIQLAGAAVHLDPSYFKVWFHLVPSLATDEAEMQGAGERRSGLVAHRVVPHAARVIPNLTPQQRRMLHGALTSEIILEADHNESSRYHSKLVGALS